MRCDYQSERSILPCRDSRRLCLQDFTLNVAGVELIVTDQNHFRCIGNKDLTVRGPVILDAEPLAWSQMQIIGFDAKEFTIDGRVFEGYPMPEKGGRIEIFTPEGVMLPHTQDGPSVWLPLLVCLRQFGSMCRKLRLLQQKPTARVSK